MIEFRTGSGRWAAGSGDIPVAVGRKRRRRSHPWQGGGAPFGGKSNSLVSHRQPPCQSMCSSGANGGRRQECRRSLTAAPSASAAVSSRHRTVATSDGLGVLPKKLIRVPRERRRPQARRAGRREHVPAPPHHHHHRREIRHQRLRLRTAHQFRDPHPGGQDAVPGGVPFDTRPPANGLEGTRCKIFENFACTRGGGEGIFATLRPQSGVKR